MIFVTLGTQNFQFNRLLKQLEILVSEKEINEEVVAQVGHTKYRPINYKAVNFIGPEEFVEYLEESKFVICHGGTSSIIKSLKVNKKVIVVPRLKRYEEHVDDHQLEITRYFEREGYIEAVYNIEDLFPAIERLEKKKYKKYISDDKKNPLLLDVYNYLQSLDVE